MGHGEGGRGPAVPAPLLSHYQAPSGSCVLALWPVFPFWGASDSATGSMWQEVGTVTHGVALYSLLEAGTAAEAPGERRRKGGACTPQQ